MFPRRRRMRHTRLHQALTELEVSNTVQIIEIPEDRQAVYYQKYAKMLAARWGMKLRTRAIRAGKRGPAYVVLAREE